ncbi:MAG: hypothetical protein VCB07_11035 [Gammaproteobacteria bacterium]
MGLLSQFVMMLMLAAVTISPSFADGMFRADSHAPLGVMGDHLHKRGEWMFSYRFMHMDMNNNRISDNGISPETIVTTIPNRFFGSPMQPPTLRVVPLAMTMDMHMFGLMYAPTDGLTFMAMLNYTERKWITLLSRAAWGRSSWANSPRIPRGLGIPASADSFGYSLRGPMALT